MDADSGSLAEAVTTVVPTAEVSAKVTAARLLVSVGASFVLATLSDNTSVTVIPSTVVSTLTL